MVTVARSISSVPRSTECSLQRELPVPEEWVVRNSDALPDVVRRRIEAHNRVAHPEGAGA